MDQVRSANVEASPAQEQDIDEAIVSSARVVFDDRRVGHVFSPVTGRVVRMAARVGERVKKGAPLATIESPDVGAALSDVDKAEADLIAAEHDYTRQRALREDGAASAAVLERSEDNWRRARAEAERARQKAFLLRSGHVDSVSQTYTLVSPIDGDVVARNVNPGIEVQGQYGGGTAQELYTIGDVDEVWVMGDLYEDELARVHVGAPVSVTAFAHPNRVFTGSVDWMSGTLDPDTRTARVRCVLDNTDGALRPGMYATMQVKADAKRALAIPRAALLKLGEYPIVFVRERGAVAPFRFTRVPVDVDEGGSGPWLAVRHGIEPGQDVVVGGAKALSQRL